FVKQCPCQIYNHDYNLLTINYLYVSILICGEFNVSQNCATMALFHKTMAHADGTVSSKGTMPQELFPRPPGIRARILKVPPLPWRSPSPLPKGRGLGRGVRLLASGGAVQMRP